MHIAHDQHAAPVLGAHFSPNATTYYRVALPVGAIGGAVAPFYEMRVSQVEAAETIVVTRMGLQVDRPTTNAHALMAALRGEGRRVVYDIDDDMAAVPAAVRSPALNLPAIEAALRGADTIVCTNPTLAGRLRRYGRDIRVLSNYVRPEDWPEPAPLPDGPPVVVLAGSASHVPDWRIVERPLQAVKPRARVRVCGVERETRRLAPYLRALADEHRPWADLAGYPAMLRGGAIGLCPLPDTAFNRCKSPIKAYEFALSGMAVIGSETQYGPVLRAAGLGHAVARAEADWRRLLDHYLSDPDARAADAAALRAYVIEHLDVRRHVETIRAAYAA